MPLGQLRNAAWSRKNPAQENVLKKEMKLRFKTDVKKVTEMRVAVDDLTAKAMGESREPRGGYYSMGL